MKILLFFALIAAVCYTQTPDPIPIPSIDPSRIKGLWWVGVAFNTTFNNEVPSNITCWSWDIEFNNTLNQMTANETYYQNGVFVQQMRIFNASQDAEWTENDGEQYVWVGLDPINYRWGTFASEYYQYAYLFNRNTTFSQKLLYDERVLLNIEGYNINDNNFYEINNTGCANSTDWIMNSNDIVY